MCNSFFLSMFQWRSQTLHRRHLLSRRCQSASPPVTLRSPRSRPGWPWPSGRPKPGATVRRSSNNPPPRRDTGLWPALRLHTAPRTLRHLESHRPPPRPPLAPPKTQPDCEPSKALHHLVTPTHTGWYYYHVKVRFTFKYYNTVAQIYVNNCCAHAHTVYKHTLICPKKRRR